MVRLDPTHEGAKTNRQTTTLRDDHTTTQYETILGYRGMKYFIPNPRKFNVPNIAHDLAFGTMSKDP